MAGTFKGWFYKFFPVLFCAAFMLIAWAWGRGAVRGYGDSIKDMRLVVLGLEQELVSASDRTDTVLYQSVYEATGISRERIDADRLVLHEMLNTALSWSDSKGYARARQVLMDAYGVPEDDGLLSGVLPPEPVFVAKNGQVISYIDTHHVNSRFESMELACLSVESGSYSYLVQAVYSCSDMVGAESMGSFVFFATVDATGHVSHVVGYPMAF